MEAISQFNNILQSFKIKAICVGYQQTDNYFTYDLKLEPHVKVREINKWSDELSLALKACGKPNVKILHAHGLVRLEFATSRTQSLRFFDYLLREDLPQELVGKGLPCLLGQTTNGDPLWMDIAQNPHLIVSGTTGSGKSTLLHTIIANLLNYSDAYLYLIDPKNIEFYGYDGKIKNLYVGYSYEDAMSVLDTLLQFMEDRYQAMRNGLKSEKLRHAVLIVDEFADLMMQDKDEQFHKRLCQLAQKCRAAKINIILSTQRPAANIVNGAIKANFPARIACRVASHVDSKVILDNVGAENLLGKGDALVRDNFRFLERFQVAHTTADEVVKFFGEGGI
jgi:S-DNA-T family DNA segregation ATPase FtsK/SpoIIIE